MRAKRNHLAPVLKRAIRTKLKFPLLRHCVPPELGLREKGSLVWMRPSKVVFAAAASASTSLLQAGLTALVPGFPVAGDTAFTLCAFSVSGGIPRPCCMDEDQEGTFRLDIRNFLQ